MPNASSRPLRYNCIHTGKHTYILAETHTQPHADTQFLAHAYAKRCKVAKWPGRYNRIAAADNFSPSPPPPFNVPDTPFFMHQVVLQLRYKTYGNVLLDSLA